MTKQVLRNLEVYRDNWCLVRAEVQNTDLALVGLADIHYGHPSCNIKKVIAVIDRIKQKNTWCILGGDLIECATRDSIGSGVYEQTLTPQDQVDGIVELLQPIKDKCLGMIKGNHEQRVWKQSGIDPCQTIAQLLNIPYCGDEGYFILAVPRGRNKVPHNTSVTICYTHTTKASKTTGLELNTVERDMARWMHFDLIMKAHGHGIACQAVQYRDINVAPPSVQDHFQWIVLTGHYLERDNSYISRKGDGPKPTGTKLLHINITKNRKSIAGEDFQIG